jgi:CBS domain-containing membrane protein
MNLVEVRMAFKNVKSSPALQQYMRDKIEKLRKLHHNIQDAQCVFKTDNFNHVVDVTLMGKNLKIFSEGVSADMYASVDVVADKLKRQLNRFKERVTDHKDPSLTDEGQLKKMTQPHSRARINTLVKDLMSARPFSLFEDDNLQFAEDLMQWRFIRHIPVINEAQKVVGLLTHRDLLRLSFSSLEHIGKSKERKLHFKIKVKDVMQKDITTVPPSLPIQYAADLMLSNKFGCLPVTKKGKLVGIITEADFVRYVSDATV